MTFNDYTLNYMTKKGMFDHEAEQVLAILKDELIKDGFDRWNDHVEGHPIGFMAALRLYINTAALAWIDANKPLAWYRPMFLSKDKRQALFAKE